MSEPTMGTEALGDNLKKLLDELGKLKDAITNPPSTPPSVPVVPADPTKPGIPDWLKKLVTWLLMLLLGYLGAKYNFTPPQVIINATSPSGVVEVQTVGVK